MRFIYETGITRYATSLIDMDIAHKNIVSEKADECIFIVEHEGVYSAGKSFENSDFIGNYEYPIYYTKRGGRVTVHNPGQIVVYPIINLRKRNINVSSYVKMLENWMIQVLSNFEIEAELSNDGIGVWTKNTKSKIGFIGIRIEKGVSTHGLCLNIHNNLSPFSKIIPCGIHGVSITSIANNISKNVDMSDVASSFIKHSPF